MSFLARRWPFNHFFKKEPNRFSEPFHFRLLVFSSFIATPAFVFARTSHSWSYPRPRVVFMSFDPWSGSLLRWPLDPATPPLYENLSLIPQDSFILGRQILYQTLHALSPVSCQARITWAQVLSRIHLRLQAFSICVPSSRRNHG